MTGTPGRAFNTASTMRPASSGSFISAAPSPLLTILPMGQPMLISKISAPVCSMAIWAASAIQTGSLPKICTAAGCSPGNWVSREKVFLSW